MTPYRCRLRKIHRNPARYAAALMMIFCALPGCSTGPDPSGRDGAIARLEYIAANEKADHPDVAFMAPPDQSLERLPPDAVEAFAPLCEVAASWQMDATASRIGSDDGSEQKDNSTRTDGLRLYAQARQLTASGDPSRAIILLEQAAETDPGVAEIWRALGDARRSAGFEASAGAAYLKSAELGIDEPEALVLAGLHVLKRDEQERAAGLFIRALSAEVPHADRLVADVAAVNLGVVLLDLGWVRAGCEVLEQGLEIPPAARMRTNVGVEAAAVHVRRGELLRRLGDGWCQLGEFERGADAYEQAAGTPAGSTTDIRMRRVYALSRAGRAAESALLLIDELRSGTMLDKRSLDALASLASRLSPRGLLADAIGELDDGGSATRRLNLLLARAAALPDRRAERLLEQALANPDIARTATARRRLLDARLSREQPDRLVLLADRIIASNQSLIPAAAMSLISIDALPGTLFARVESGIDSPSRRWALLAEIALLLGDKERITDILEKKVLPTDSPDAVARLVTLAAAAGRWDIADRAIARLADMPATDQRTYDAALLRAYEAAQRFEAALSVARRRAESDGATTDDLLRLSALAHLQGDVEEARNALDRAREIDPSDERVYRALIGFHGPGGPMPDIDRTTEIGRDLRENVPAGRLLRQLVISELLRRGMFDQTSDRIDRLFREDPTDSKTLDTVLTWWRRLAAAGRDDEISLDPVRDEISNHPASAGLVRLLVNGLVLLGKPDEAIAEINAFRARTGSIALDRLAEKITREVLEDIQLADHMTEVRIGPPPYSIGEAVELVSLEAGRLDGTNATDSKIPAIKKNLARIPHESGLTDVQRSTISNAIGRIAVHLNSRREASDPEHPLPEATTGAALDCFSWAAGRNVPLAPATHDLRLTLLVEGESDLSEISASAKQAFSEYPETEQALARRVADLLMASSREKDAFGWVAESSFDQSGSIRPVLLAEWFRLVIITSDRDRAAEFIDSLISRDSVAKAWEILRPRGDLWDSRDGSSPAEFGYLMAQYAGTSANPKASEIFLRLTLEYDPAHPWACNDLGYGMLESGGSLAEAERLIEIAYQALPDRANVIDSLGWVRYHRGRLEDEIDPDSGQTIEGAITLLRTAAELLGSDDDGTVNDHLGDALYAAGRVDEATRAWRQAATRASNALSRLRASGRTGGVRFREIQDLAAAAAMKRNAVELGAEPEIEPQRGVEPGSATGGPVPDSDKP